MKRSILVPVMSLDPRIPGGLAASSQWREGEVVRFDAETPPYPVTLKFDNGEVFVVPNSSLDYPLSIYHGRPARP